jgi:hypothetical protein
MQLFSCSEYNGIVWLPMKYNLWFGCDKVNHYEVGYDDVMINYQ